MKDRHAEAKSRPVEILLRRGVKIPCPEAVEIGQEVNPGRIAAGVTIHTGSKIYGAETSIGPNCIIGSQAPATVENCRLGRGVKLGGGYFAGAVFLDNANIGSSAHVREGTILEEQTSGAHGVGLKHTILLPFVTLGSLINFCDILMAGGTSRQNHSEVGSSYIHFNYTPHQDKATASLLGDVPRGVLLDQAPIFLGGQGGLVGPSCLAYGTVIPAGVIFRKDIREPGHIHFPPPHKGMSAPFRPGVYKSIQRIIRNNLVYIGNIRALETWYRFVRPLFGRDGFDRACLEGAQANLGLASTERIKRLGQLADRMAFSLRELEKMHHSLPGYGIEQQKFSENWANIKSKLEQEPQTGNCPELSAELESSPKGNYIETIQSLSQRARDAAFAWLQAIVDQTVESASGLF
jgi:UDP-N-acetylglucosamine/UDP-N-acetylgalactosamine diphosphorylase